jgi:hypothetical protein
MMHIWVIRKIFFVTVMCRLSHVDWMKTTEWIWIHLSFLFCFLTVYVSVSCLFVNREHSQLIAVSNNGRMRECVRWPRIRWRAWVHVLDDVVFVGETNDANNGTDITWWKRRRRKKKSIFFFYVSFFKSPDSTYDIINSTTSNHAT